MGEKTCKRCGGQWPTNDNIAETTFWGAIETSTETTTQRRVRVLATYFNRNPKRGSGLIRVDERQELCDPCWDQLIGRFMQGRSVDALPGKEGM
jgi:hypothetical protein